MEEEKEALNFVKTKSYEELHVFDASNCLGYYSLESILASQIGNIATDKPMDCQLFSVVHNLVIEPEKLFYFLSVCPEEVFDFSYDCWPCNNNLRVTVNDVIRVFLNWGATLETLGLENDKQLSSCFVPTQVPVTLENFPTPRHVKFVLDAIPRCLTDVEDEEKFNLLKVLMVASLDVRLGQHKFKFNQTICKVLETFSSLTSGKAAEMVEHLGLMRLGLQNAARICCSFFTTCDQVADFKIFAVRHLLHIKFGLRPPLEPIQSLLEELICIEKITVMYPLLDIYVLILLLNTLLVTCCYKQSPNLGPDYLPVIEGFYNWIQSVHFELMTPMFIHTVEGGFIREKCVRFKADCVELMRIHKNKNFFKTMDLVDKWNSLTC